MGVFALGFDGLSRRVAKFLTGRLRECARKSCDYEKRTKSAKSGALEKNGAERMELGKPGPVAVNSFARTWPQFLVFFVASLQGRDCLARTGWRSERNWVLNLSKLSNMFKDIREHFPPSIPSSSSFIPSHEASDGQKHKKHEVDNHWIAICTCDFLRQPLENRCNGWALRSGFWTGIIVRQH